MDKEPYCCGLTFKKFDTKTDEYDIEFHYTKDVVPDTNLPSYNPLVRLPNLKAWKTWFDSGAIAVYPYITEFIARSKRGSDFGTFIPEFV